MSAVVHSAEQLPRRTALVTGAPARLFAFDHAATIDLARFTREVRATAELLPAATFAAVWSVWRLLRVWGARRPLPSLALALLVIVLGGYTHASFGNFHLARIWQGKAVLVSVLAH